MDYVGNHSRINVGSKHSYDYNISLKNKKNQYKIIKK